MADDGGDGISLREAITAANNTAGVDSITFDRSFESVFVNLGARQIRLTQGELEITDGLSIDGTIDNRTSDATGAFIGGLVITGDANRDDRIMSFPSVTNVSASFGGTAGAADDLLDDNSRVINFSATTGDLMLTGLTITGGRTTTIGAAGGGIIFSSSGTLTLDNSTVSGNSTTGAAAYGGGISTVSGNVSLVNSTLSDNSSAGAGAGIRTNSGDVSLINSTLSGNNSGDDGGGIDTGSGDISLNNSTLSDNSSVGDGGGIRTSLGDVSLVNSTLSVNNSVGDGGGIGH